MSPLHNVRALVMCQVIPAQMRAEISARYSRTAAAGLPVPSSQTSFHMDWTSLSSSWQATKAQGRAAAPCAASMSPLTSSLISRPESCRDTRSPAHRGIMPYGPNASAFEGFKPERPGSHSRIKGMANLKQPEPSQERKLRKGVPVTSNLGFCTSALYCRA